ncbi:cell division protein FtsQ/DivIB [Oleiagrimonas sp. MCCC 1A03011]|uniref:cell division protein FtsQ/DivIB n=1 Tax=Oleiagrimonas sp. MCCC 1A03011 TaxID=1926883 RepID=UPI000DC35001|nr:cell division protein FtsQ/DivIB [Oleiagrimonas sp. MCCC 1A03011]RAP59516.1 cell division protein FtsQ [Oleiagrimonas sp. MCCC 1A03011]
MKAPISLRGAAWLIAVALVILPVVGLVRGWFASDRWPIRTLQVQASYQHVSADKIRATVEPYLGKGFFATRLDHVQKAVQALPWVASAEARKVWPDTLELRVHERQPVAHWNGDRLIGRDGGIFTAPGAASISGLPQLSGPDAREPEVVAFYQKVRDEFSPVGLRVDGVTLSGRASWRLQLGNGAELVIGSDDVEQRLKRFLDVYPRLAQDGDGKPFTRVDLRYANGFAVRWPQPEANAQPAAGGGVPQS